MLWFLCCYTADRTLEREHSPQVNSRHCGQVSMGSLLISFLQRVHRKGTVVCAYFGSNFAHYPLFQFSFTQLKTTCVQGHIHLMILGGKCWQSNESRLIQKSQQLEHISYRQTPHENDQPFFGMGLQQQTQKNLRNRSPRQATAAWCQAFLYQWLEHSLQGWFLGHCSCIRLEKVIKNMKTRLYLVFLLIINSNLQLSKDLSEGRAGSHVLFVDQGNFSRVPISIFCYPADRYYTFFLLLPSLGTFGCGITNFQVYQLSINILLLDLFRIQLHPFFHHARLGHHRHVLPLLISLGHLLLEEDYKLIENDGITTPEYDREDVLLEQGEEGRASIVGEVLVRIVVLLSVGLRLAVGMFGVWIGPWIGLESAIILLSFLLVTQNFVSLLDPHKFLGI